MKKRIACVITAVCFAVCCTTACGEQVEPFEDVFTMPVGSETTVTAQTTAATSEEWKPSMLFTATTAAPTETTTTTTTTTTIKATTTSKATTTAKKSESSSSGSTTKATAKSTTAASSVSRITGTSPNTAFYKQRLVVAGDSVASGYAAYGRIPYEHNVAKVNVSIRNYPNFTFNPTGVNLGMIDALKAIKPSLILTSMGMNDWGISSASFGNYYKAFLQKVRAACPNSVILVGAISPTAAVNKYPHVKLSVVKGHNAQLKAIADSMDEKVIYFDAFSVVSSDGAHLDARYAASDGLHLQPSAYDALINAMSVVLDQHGMKDKMV